MEVRTRALDYAKQYIAMGTTYEWGAQDPLPRLSVDCSGLVVRVYGYACEDLGYRLPFRDMNAAGMVKYCKEVPPEPGDLIFMGDNNTWRSCIIHFSHV